MFPSELVDKDVDIVCPQTGKSVKGTVKSHGVSDDVWEYHVVPRQNSSGKFHETLLCTRPQKVATYDSPHHTYDLRKGDRILTSCSDVGYDATQWGQGFMYAVGLTHVSSLSPERYPKYQNRLEGLIANGQTIGPPVIPYNGLAVEKASFIQGYLSALNWPTKLRTVNESFMDFFVENASLAGLIITGNISRIVRNDYETFSLYVDYTVTYSKGLHTKFFRVINVKKCNYTYPVYSVHLNTSGYYCLDGGWTFIGD